MSFGSLLQLCAGLAVTLEISALVIVLSLAIGLPLGVIAAYGPLPAQLVVRLYNDIIRGLPILIMLFVVFYGLPVLGIDVSGMVAGVAALTLFKSAQTAETTRGALQSVPRGQIEAAKSIGLGFGQRMIQVVLPLAARRFLPPWVNGVADTVKGSALVSLLGVVDLMNAIQEGGARTFRPMPFYVIGVVVYIAINYSLSRASRHMEHSYARH